ncbi:MAG: glutamate-5-semialdehyde dehydrogenase [Deltaproteobacteria bacterium]|nr:glutamate-5-semialdehyde dehydrogenase [Deltaproteobacteria bacterium]
MSALDVLLRSARRAQGVLSRASSPQRALCLEVLGARLAAARRAILEANREDLDAATELSPALRDRLTLTPLRLDGVLKALGEVLALEDPLGEERPLPGGSPRPNGLRVYRRRIPLGVLAVIYEARPNVTVEASALCLKSGNAVVLRGGREAARTNLALAREVRGALGDAGLDPDAVTLLEDPSRDAVRALLGAVGKVDLVVPRGGPGLMAFVDEHARVPVIRHGQGICHLYVHADADHAMARALVVNSKVQRPGVCNALETLLVHREAAPQLLPSLGAALREEGVELRACARSAELLRASGVPAVDAHPEDWDTEFLALILAVRCVDSLDDALAHIARHGTGHTASVCTRDPSVGERFLREVDASCVLWNASTRFNDGGELGLGAELGISTSRMHAFGPMGLRELTAEKFVVRGEGQVRS